MKVLHTADWHLGARFHGQRRGKEEDDALDQVVEHCRRLKVDVVIVAGDIFDHANPAALDERRYYRTLVRLVRDASVATVVVVAGNHDSALRLDGPRELARAMDVHVVGRLGREADAERAVVPLRGRDGTVGGVCAALPYLRDGDLRLPEIGESHRQIHERYVEALGRRYQEVRNAARRLHPSLPLMVTGHCQVQGGTFGGEERTVQFGGLGTPTAEALAGDASYLALGHLHRPQDVAETHWRYSGSLLPTGFDETGTQREVVFFELADDGPARGIQKLPMKPFRPYRRLHGKLADVEAAIDALAEADADRPAPWCEAVVDLDGPRPGLAPALVDRCRTRGWNLVSVRRERPAREAARADTGARLGLHELTPEEVFVRRHEDEYGGPPDDELMAEFRSLLDCLDEESLEEESLDDDAAATVERATEERPD